MARKPLMVQPVPRQRRMLRKPEHTWQVSQKPFVIQPIVIAPVLPGETLKNFLFQSRCVTDPIKNPLIGWWKEYYFFYVKLRDLAGRATFEQMMLDQGYDVSALNSASEVATHHKGSRLNYTRMCLERVAETYFRDDGEAWNATNASIDSLPLAKINREGWWNSLIDSTDAVDPQIIDEAGSDTLTGLQLERAQREAMFDQMMSQSNMDFEDYLRMAGVNIRPEELHMPEIIRYVREWTYPTNTVDPADGSVASACSWSVQERGDKDRFFREPGFIFGCTVTRPKVYFAEAVGSAAHNLDDAFSWLPALLRDDPRTSLRTEDNATGAWEGLTNDYIWDTRDLFLYGDQFVGGVYDPDSTTGINTVSLPDADASHRYVTDADIDSLFITADTACFVREDGVVRFTIATPEGIDYTPTTVESGNVSGITP